MEYQRKDELICSNCGNLIPENVTECPMCGTNIKEMLEKEQQVPTTSEQKPQPLQQQSPEQPAPQPAVSQQPPEYEQNQYAPAPETQPPQQQPQQPEQYQAPETPDLSQYMTDDEPEQETAPAQQFSTPQQQDPQQIVQENEPAGLPPLPGQSNEAQVSWGQSIEVEKDEDGSIVHTGEMDSSYVEENEDKIQKQLFSQPDTPPGIPPVQQADELDYAHDSKPIKFSTDDDDDDEPLPPKFQGGELPAGETPAPPVPQPQGSQETEDDGKEYFVKEIRGNIMICDGDTGDVVHTLSQEQFNEKYNYILALSDPEYVKTIVRELNG